MVIIYFHASQYTPPDKESLNLQPGLSYGFNRLCKSINNLATVMTDGSAMS